MLFRRCLGGRVRAAEVFGEMIDRIWREKRGVGRLSIAIGGMLRRAAFSQFMRAETARSPSNTEV